MQGLELVVEAVQTALQSMEVVREAQGPVPLISVQTDQFVDRLDCIVSS